MSELLNIALSAAVPLRMLEVRGWTHDRRADAFNKLALGIACGAYQPGGITVFGQHWEAPAS